MTSATLCDDVKRILSASDYFKPFLDSQASEAQGYAHRARKDTPRRFRQKTQEVKIGHGGTLDPGASGVIAFGVNDGTKALHRFTTSAKKGYEAVILFGVATDTFDADGKVVGRKAAEHVTREQVEAALEQFRGRIMQRPSVFSALHRGGVRMHEYARQGKDIPELEKRQMHVSSMEVVDWMDGGSHEYHWPEAEIENDRKEAFVKTLRFDEIGGVEVVKGNDEPSIQAEPKKRRGDSRPDERHRKHAKVTEEDQQTSTLESRPPVLPSKEDEQVAPLAEAQPTTATEPKEAPEPTQREPKGPCPAPAARIRMTVSSGFYVRSLAHDLGVAVGSLAFMTSLKRTKQSCFELDDNVIAWEAFEQGEDVWGPKVAEQLALWHDRARALEDDIDSVQ